MIQLDNTLFDDIVLYEQIDRETCINEIQKRCWSLPVNCDSPGLFKQFVNHFFKKNYNIFRELWETMQYDYNPIENYDRYENSNREMENAQNSERELNADTENEVSAMNSSDYQPDRKQTDSSKDNFGTSGNGTDVFESHIHGNIGVTTSQQMIQAQREVVRYDFYNEVAEKFENELCVSNYSDY